MKKYNILMLILTILHLLIGSLSIPHSMTMIELNTSEKIFGYLIILMYITGIFAPAALSTALEKRGKNDLAKKMIIFPMITIPTFLIMFLSMSGTLG